MNKIGGVFVLWAIVVLCTFIAGCSDDPSPTSSIDIANRDSIISYLERNNLIDSTFEDGSGLFYQVIREGGGESISSNDILSIYYSASLLDGAIFDEVPASSGIPVRLKHNAGAVYPLGLDIGLGLMSVGDIYLLYVPSSKAYGKLDGWSIPVNSIITIQVEIVSKETESDRLTQERAAIEQMIVDNDLNNTTNHPVDMFVELSEGLYYKRTSVGIADSNPANGDSVRISYQAFKVNNFPSGPSFQSTTAPLSYLHNTSYVFSGLDEAISNMELNERATVAFTSSKAYGSSAFAIPSSEKPFLVENKVIPAYTISVTPYEVLVFQVELLDPMVP